MINPEDFDHMINWAFVSELILTHRAFDRNNTKAVATFIYTAIGYAGYFMFGNKVNEEVRLPV
jgi:vesicular inhibitory amino acid transporter